MKEDTITIEDDGLLYDDEYLTIQDENDGKLSPIYVHVAEKVIV